MDRDLENLERQVEEQWSALGLDLSAKPPSETVERVRSAVHHELNEAWLADQPQPVPDEALLRRVAAAVRGEATRVAGRRTRIIRLRWWLEGGAAAAAAVLLVVGLAQLSGPPQAGGHHPVSADAEAIERFVQAADQVWSADPVTREIREDLDAIEESVTSWPPGSDADSDNLYDFNSRLDTPVRGPMREGLSDAGGWPAGAMG